MPFCRELIFSGAILEIIERECTPQGKHISRGERRGITDAEQQLVNLRRAMLQLMRLLNCNFKAGDYWLTLTFAQEPDEREAAGALARFLRRLRRYCCKKTGQELKYVQVTERGDKYGRLHIHLVCQKMGLAPEELAALWGQGRVDMQTLDGDPYYRWLMVYLEKHERSQKGKKRWSCSRNLDKPVMPPPKIIKRKVLRREPQAPKGYYILDYETRADRYGQRRYTVCCKTDHQPGIPPELAERMAREAEEAVFWQL